MHFKTAAIHRECAARAAAQLGIPVNDVTRNQALAVSTPKDVKLVPIYRGISARFANEVRAQQRREERKKEEKSFGQRFVEGLAGITGVQTGAVS